jgi:hypothetical protein
VARVVWRPDQVVAIETRTGLFVPAQLLTSPHLVVYDAFYTEAERAGIEAGGVDLAATPVLLHAAVTRQFLSRGRVTPLRLAPTSGHRPPDRRLRATPGSRRVTAWPGTPHELSFIDITDGGGSLVEYDPTAPVGRPETVVVPSVPADDDATIDGHELESVRIYPEFNERLYLCHRLGRNVDPLKDVAFDRELPQQYRTYLALAASTLTEPEWLGLPAT